MRQASKKCLFWVVILLLLATGGVACMRDLLPELPEGFGFGLSVKPQIFRGPEGNLHGRTTETKANKDDDDTTIKKNDGVYGRDELWENYYRTLDIFVKKSTDGDDASWHKQYHLVAGQGVITDPNRYGGTGLLDQAKQLLTRSWEEDYHQGESYDIYVTANNPHTVAGAAPANLTALKALSTHTDNMFQYNAESAILSDNWAGTVRPFIMDGKKTGWQIEYDTGGNPLPEQVFDVNLERAAAKIILNVRFSDAETFPKAPLSTVDNPNPDPELDPQGRIIYVDIKEYLSYIEYTAGEPRCKTVNFNYDVSDIKDGNTPSPEHLETLDGNFLMKKYGTSTNNCENTYSMVTYTYPIDWTRDTDSNRVPFILLSIWYTSTEDANKQLRCYYRIPVCDEASVNKLERNHIYIVDAEIASLGSFNENLETQDEQLRLEYHVVPWTETDISQEATSVRLSDTKYLTVTPTTYTLKGDDYQSVDLAWYASVSTNDNRFVDINVSTLDVSYVNYQGATQHIQGTVVKEVKTASGTWVTSTDANTDGTTDIRITSTAPASGNAHGEEVIITITPSGIIHVESKALDSRAVKNISFTVYLKGTDGIDAVPITIRHFPLDNIQSFTGSWSSRVAKDASGNVITEPEYSFYPKDGYTEETGTFYWTYSDYSSPQNNNQIYITRVEEILPASGTANSNNYYQRNDWSYNFYYYAYSWNNSEQNAVEYNGYYYWRTGNNNRRVFHRARYTSSKRYVTGKPSTGDWVAWGEKNGTYQDGLFTAKVYRNNSINLMNGQNSTGGVYTQLTNNHMYVVQITSTSDKYALGKPVLDGSYQSQDKVASPAFMIASQLGAVSTTGSGATAATHCGTYMEVDSDGTRYVGWRLPTKQEIEVIIGYQDGTYTGDVTMTTVLSGEYYWALDGTTAHVESGSQGTATNAYVRCVRDLTLDDINRLNGTGN